MTLAPDPTEITPPKDPTIYARPRLMGPGFWVAIAFGVLCIAGGYGLAKFGPKLTGPGVLNESAAPAEAPAAPESASRHPTAELEPASRPAAPITTDPALEGRIADLEAGQARLTEAAGAALAVAALSEAAQSSRPFDRELSQVEAVLPISVDVRGLRRLAETGAPTRAALTEELDDAASRASVAARDPGEGAGLWARASHALAAIVTVRYVGSTTGTSPDAMLARAQRLMDEGDVEGALQVVDRLPERVRTTLTDWRLRAERRAEVDRRIAVIRGEALADLAQTRRAAR
ncbi:hypothetical protein P7B02_06530 [Caulobacter segnis]|uniref:COG4223 family protein n=1 Tax=Caulobacter segnis TaxID=88688 RepID=UPI00240FDBEA|nr:hypothetical protein [Caulobacter segnis]MDG2521193.1 hypothetical protein [Caulobacter segnis]